VVDLGRPPSSFGTQVNWPQTWNLEALEDPRTPPAKRVDKFVIVNANKLSFVPGELYSLRRELVTTLNQVETYGPDWDFSLPQKSLKAAKEFAISARYRTGFASSALRFWFSKPTFYMGKSSDKLSTLAKYNYSLVIENSMEFMTEKRFDSLFAGTLPVYVGPKIERFGIPSTLALQASPTADSVKDCMELARGMDIEAWRVELLDWLKSEGVERSWSSEFVVPKIVNTIDAELDRLKIDQV
jgi:hypothetical protein